MEEDWNMSVVFPNLCLRMILPGKNGSGGGNNADANTECGLSMPLMSSLGFYPEILCTQWSMSVT